MTGDTSDTMKIHDLFVEDVTRNIPPVVYFHEQSPERLADEVKEYIITGGWNEGHPNHVRVPNGIHEQYVRLLRGITAELNKRGGPELPNVWISGFYGSGKSSFAKLLGLALDGVALPGGKSLAEAWLARNVSDRAKEMAEAWAALRQKVDPIAVVFDIGGIARDNENIHNAAVRQLQERLGYCATDSLVADYELNLERDGQYEKFLDVAHRTLGKPWSEVKNRSLVSDDFSFVMHEMDNRKFPDPTSWFTSRGGTTGPGRSPEDAVDAIRDMLKFRKKDATLFFVIDEVSQYIHSSKDRTDRLRAFATALGATLKGKVWLFALGQQKLDEEADNTMLIWARDRFPNSLRVHLAATNIRDVVHRRLLHKKQEHVAMLRKLFEDNRPEMKLYAYGCGEITADEFVEIYPMLPGQIDLLLQITSALRTRSTRSQGDDQAIRGLLQLMGELFRDQKLAEEDVGSLVSLDRIYEIQHTALDSDTQASMARIMTKCAELKSDLALRAAKAVAMLELIQESEPTTADLVSRCLYNKIGQGNQTAAVSEVLETLRSLNLLGYSEKLGFKIQSSASEEWERERREVGVSQDKISEHVLDALKNLAQSIDKPKYSDRAFPLGGLFSDGREHQDSKLLDPRDEASVTIDFRFLSREDRNQSEWIRKSDESNLKNRLIWVCGENEALKDTVRELAKTIGMVEKYRPRRDSLAPQKRMLWQTEEIRLEELTEKVRESVAACWKSGHFYFRGQVFDAREQGDSFNTSANRTASKILPSLFSMFDGTTVTPNELAQLLAQDLSGPSAKFMTTKDGIGILDLDDGRYEPTCTGVVPQRIREKVELDGGVSGSSLLSHFGGPPFGYHPELVKACIAGLIRGSKVKVQLPDGGIEATSLRDVGVKDLFGADRVFRRADFFPSGDDDIGPQGRARICKFFEQELGLPLDRDDGKIADAVASEFPKLATRLREVLTLMQKLPGNHPIPDEFVKLDQAFGRCVAKVRETRPTIQQVKRNLDVLRDGIRLLKMLGSELSDDVVRKVNELGAIRDYQWAQLREIDAVEATVNDAGERIEQHLSSERPWREIIALEPAVATIREAYRTKRSDLLGRQETATEAARGRVKQAPVFSTLTSDEAHTVLRPFATAVDNTTADAVAPKLADLVEPFDIRLQKSEEAANEKLDEIISEKDKKLVRKVPINIKNRVIKDKADVDTLVEEIRSELMQQLDAGVSIRIV